MQAQRFTSEDTFVVFLFLTTECYGRASKEHKLDRLLQHHGNENGKDANECYALSTYIGLIAFGESSIKPEQQ